MRNVSVVLWSQFLTADPEVRVRFPGFTQPGEYKLRSYLEEIVADPV
jgi:hypothetical protein